MVTKSKIRFFVGIFSLIMGFILILNSLSGITGFVVSENIEKTPSSVFGLVFLISGLALLLIERQEKEGLLASMVKTRKFEKATRKHNPKEIRKALAKIGTGLAGEEYLRHEKVWSVRTSKGGRITYERDGKEIKLLDYFPQHY
jgi:hypothetical protein